MADESGAMSEDREWLTMAPSGGRRLVTVMESGDIYLVDDMTPDEARQAMAMVSKHLAERKAEEDRLRKELKKLRGEE